MGIVETYHVSRYLPIADRLFFHIQQSKILYFSLSTLHTTLLYFYFIPTYVNVLQKQNLKDHKRPKQLCYHTVVLGLTLILNSDETDTQLSNRIFGFWNTYLMITLKMSPSVSPMRSRLKNPQIVYRKNFVGEMQKIHVQLL